jgi:hypothetical protein
MTHGEKSDLIRELRGEISGLKALLTRAADALDELNEWTKPTWMKSAKPLIAELRKAAQ